MIATRELNVFHIGTKCFQSTISSTGTFGSNYIVSITMENAEFHILCRNKTCRIHCTANRNCRSKNIRKAHSHIERTHASH